MLNFEFLHFALNSLQPNRRGTTALRSLQDKINNIVTTNLQESATVYCQKHFQIKLIN